MEGSVEVEERRRWAGDVRRRRLGERFGADGVQSTGSLGEAGGDFTRAWRWLGCKGLEPGGSDRWEARAAGVGEDEGAGELRAEDMQSGAVVECGECGKGVGELDGLYSCTGRASTGRLARVVPSASGGAATKQGEIFRKRHDDQGCSRRGRGELGAAHVMRWVGAVRGKRGAAAEDGVAQSEAGRAVATFGLSGASAGPKGEEAGWAVGASAREPQPREKRAGAR